MGGDEVGFGGPPPRSICRKIEVVQAERASVRREHRLRNRRQLTLPNIAIQVLISSARLQKLGRLVYAA